MESYLRNTYFILDLPLAAVEALMIHCVSNSLVSLYDGSYMVTIPMNVKPPEAFNAYTPLTHSEMKIEKAIREQDRPEL